MSGALKADIKFSISEFLLPQHLFLHLIFAEEISITMITNLRESNLMKLFYMFFLLPFLTFLL